MEYVSANKTTGVDLTSSLVKACCVRLVAGVYFDVTIVQIMGVIIARVQFLDRSVNGIDLMSDYEEKGTDLMRAISELRHCLV